MIRTDGISVCILFIRVDVNGKPLSKTYQNKKCCQEENIDYIEKANIEEIKNKKFVCADPNMSDLIYCGYKDENGEYIVNPEAELKLTPNSKIIVLGRPEQIEGLNTEYNIN